MDDLLGWRVGLHDRLQLEGVLGHGFVQDVDDIPGGCGVCWLRLEGFEGE